MFKESGCCVVQREARMWVHFVVIWVCLRSSGSQQVEGKASTLIMPYLCQLMFSISNQLIGKQILSNRKAHFNSKGSQIPFSELPPLGLPATSLFEYPQFPFYPVLTEKDLPAKLDDLTTSVRLTRRHMWSVREATVVGAVGGPCNGEE